MSAIACYRKLAGKMPALQSIPMPEQEKTSNADWLLRGVLTKLGDMFDQFTGRRWVPSSSLAASELIERIKKLLDTEAKDVPGKGRVVPHNIKLKMQWDKFSDESDDKINALRDELLAAAADHINDSLYYTFAPVSLEVKRDYFIEGVKLYVSFDRFTDEDSEVEQNVTILGRNDAITASDHDPPESFSHSETYLARFELDGKNFEKRLDFPAGHRCTVGRTNASGLILDDASISKFHASLALDETGVLIIADTGSTNGTFVNGQRIAYGKAMRLAGEVCVKFGEIEVTFERMTEPKSEPPA